MSSLLSKQKRRTKSVTYVPDRSRGVAVVGRRPSIRKRQTTVRPIDFEISLTGGSSSSTPSTKNEPSKLKIKSQSTDPAGKQVLEISQIQSAADSGSELVFTPTVESPLPCFKTAAADGVSSKPGDCAVRSLPLPLPLPGRPFVSRIPRRVRHSSAVQPMNVGEKINKVIDHCRKSMKPPERDEGIGGRHVKDLQPVCDGDLKLPGSDQPALVSDAPRQPDLQRELGDEESGGNEAFANRAEEKTKANDHDSDQAKQSIMASESSHLESGIGRRSSKAGSSIPKAKEQMNQVRTGISGGQHTRGLQTDSEKSIQNIGLDKDSVKHVDVANPKTGSTELQAKTDSTKSENIQPKETAGEETDLRKKENRGLNSEPRLQLDFSAADLASVEPDDEILTSQQQASTAEKAAAPASLGTEKSIPKYTKTYSKGSALLKRKRSEALAELGTASVSGAAFQLTQAVNDSLDSVTMLSSAEANITSHPPKRNRPDAVATDVQSFQMASVLNCSMNQGRKGFPKKTDNHGNKIPNQNDRPLQDLVIRLRQDFCITSKKNRKRLPPTVAKLTELDVVVSALDEEIQEHFAVDQQNSRENRMFMHKYTESLFSKIRYVSKNSRNIKSLSREVRANQLVLKRKRQELLRLQVERSRLEMDAAKTKAKQTRPVATSAVSSSTVTDEDIEDFLLRLRHLG